LVPKSAEWRGESQGHRYIRPAVQVLGMLGDTSTGTFHPSFPNSGQTLLQAGLRGHDVFN